MNFCFIYSTIWINKLSYIFFHRLIYIICLVFPGPSRKLSFKSNQNQSIYQQRISLHVFRFVLDHIVDADLYKLSFAVAAYSFISLQQSTQHRAYFWRRHLLVFRFWFFLLIYVFYPDISEWILFRIMQ